MVGNAEVGQDVAGCQFSNAFFDGQAVAAEVLFEVGLVVTVVPKVPI